MNTQRRFLPERILHRIEDHIDEWRRREGVREAELAEHRAKLWEEAAKREKLLAEAIGEEEARQTSVEDVVRRHRVVFVVHSGEAAEALETFAHESSRLMNVIPGRNSRTNGTGVKGSWLIFEDPS
ncbi:hypothetical protein GBA65_07610 [Rubrobacter marinus]|uniref:Uncharacterized protein n=1 Tax=Rubrobacter marinus TaxID=2653852 RepID=A0A6G8PW32_9ACTN|nr:hypothetical protein [Rubrobacter marinus]QIN78414.1 hypothetical protein GBA65_07610 [Rubrobacter marinus]